MGGLLVPGSPEYQWILATTDVRPTTAYGTQVTPAQNSKGSFAELIDGALVVNDVYGIAININNNTVATAARDTILDIGFDESAGTSYTVRIPDLLCSCVQFHTGTSNSCGVWYYFPLFIKAGTSIAARASVNNATVGTLNVWAVLYGKPRNPEFARVGSYVTAYGITAASSSGTAVTSGTTSEGAWTSLGTTSKDHWWWQQGFGVNDGTMSAVAYFMDLAVGDASNKRVVFLNDLITTGSAEVVGVYRVPGMGFASSKSGDIVYGRLQCSGTADASLSMAAYGLGG